MNRISTAALEQSVYTFMDAFFWFWFDFCFTALRHILGRLPLIQEEQLSVTGERMCTKFWLG